MDNGWEDFGDKKNEQRRKREYIFAKLFLATWGFVFLILLVKEILYITGLIKG